MQRNGLCRWITILSLGFALAGVLAGCDEEVQDVTAEYQQLPAAVSGLSTDDLRARVDEYVAEIEAKDYEWWFERPELETAKEMYAIALQLEDAELIARCAYWLGNRLRYEDELAGIRLLESAIPEAEAAGLDELAAFLLSALADCQEDIGLSYDALESAHVAESAFQELQHSGGRQKALGVQAHAARNLGRDAEMADAFQQIAVLRKMEGRSGRGIAPQLALAGMALMDCGRHHEGLALIEEAAAETESDSEYPSTMQRHFLGQFQFQFGMFKTAEETLKHELELDAELQPSTYRTSAHAWLVKLYLLTGREALALEVAEDAFSILDSLEDALDEASSQFDAEKLIAERRELLLALIQHELSTGIPEQAVNWLRHAEETLVTTGITQHERELETALARAYVQLGSVENAQQWLDAARDDWLNTNVPGLARPQPELMIIEARIHAINGDERKAAGVLKDALEACSKVEVTADRLLRAEVLIEFGKFLRVQDDHKDAAEYLSKAYSLLLADAYDIHWQASLLFDLDAKLQECLELLSASLIELGRQDEIASAEFRLAHAMQLGTFLQAQAELPQDAIDSQLLEYRSSLHELKSIRQHWRWFTWGMSDKEIRKRLTEHQPKELHKQLILEFEREKAENQERQAELKVHCMELLGEIATSDPQLFELITLPPG